MRVVGALLGVALLAGCGGSDSTTGPKSRAAAQNTTVSANLKDRFLLDHNAAFNGGVTFR